jgi:hypothetical protein
MSDFIVSMESADGIRPDGGLARAERILRRSNARMAQVPTRVGSPLTPASAMASHG